MDPRNYEQGAVESVPEAPINPSSGYPTNGNPQSGTAATLPGAHWFYKVGESLRKIITDAGLTPDDTGIGQLKEALVSPQTDVDAGTDDNRFVTPKKLRWGFSVSLTANGYIVFPSWLGGLIFQWGIASATTQQFSVNFPIAFPNAALSVHPTDASNLNSAAVLTWRFDLTTNSVAHFYTEAAPTDAGRINYFAIGY